jgi:hypothetical protein
LFGGDMKRFVVSILLLGLALTLAACSRARLAQGTPAPATLAQSTGATATVVRIAPGPATPIVGSTSPSVPHAAQTDTHGAVTFEVAPLNLAAAGALEFNVSMNTHSVNLGWNLAAQSTLATDTDGQVQGQSWPVGNGHQYFGTLSFPAQTADEASLLAGAKRLTLTIRGTNVARRVFAWDLSQ